MNIQLNNDYRIVDDPLQFVLQRRYEREKDGSEYWVNEGYYGTLNSLVKGLLTHEVHDADIQSLNDIIKVLHTCTEEICRNLSAGGK